MVVSASGEEHRTATQAGDITRLSLHRDKHLWRRHRHLRYEGSRAKAFMNQAQTDRLIPILVTIIHTRITTNKFRMNIQIKVFYVERKDYI